MIKEYTLYNMCLSSYIVISCMKVTVHFEFLVTTCVIVQAHASDIKVNIMYNVLSLFSIEKYRHLCGIFAAFSVRLSTMVSIR